MVIAGGNAAIFVFYPIHADASKPETRLTNWAIMARISNCRSLPPRREDWNRPGRREEALPFVRDKFCLGFVDPASLIEATGTFHEYPMCDRDPLPRWSFGRVTLLGDAAHPMYPVGGDGASQAILDTRCVARLLAEKGDVVAALAAYEVARLPVRAKIVRENRLGGPERVIDVVEERAPDGFVNLDTIVSHAELESIVKGYARMAGFDQTQVNR
jgi:5-methylphenazine-1-carboxylate 1-monooxygenase